MKDTRSEHEIQTAIKKLLKKLGFAVWSTSQGRASAVTPGVPDLFVAGMGRNAWVEVKAGYNKQSPEQIAFQREIEANGGIYILAYSEQDLLDWINSISGVITNEP
jgi:hypothetical protein